MDGSGEAVERIVRISMDGAEHIVRITGSGAKAFAAFLISTLNEENKTHGAMQLRNMLKTEKELKVFILEKGQLKDFKREVRRFGVTYCELGGAGEGRKSYTEIMVKAEDASKVHRIFERLGFGGIDTSSYISDIEKPASDSGLPEKERENSIEMGGPINESPMHLEKGEPENPFATGAAQQHRSEPISEKQGSEGTVKKVDDAGKKSVRIEIAEIKKEREQGFGNDSGTALPRTRKERKNDEAR